MNVGIGPNVTKVRVWGLSPSSSVPSSQIATNAASPTTPQKRRRTTGDFSPGSANHPVGATAEPHTTITSSRTYGSPVCGTLGSLRHSGYFSSDLRMKS